MKIGRVFKFLQRFKAYRYTVFFIAFFLDYGIVRNFKIVKNGFADMLYDFFDNIENCEITWKRLLEADSKIDWKNGEKLKV